MGFYTLRNAKNILSALLIIPVLSQLWGWKYYYNIYSSNNYIYLILVLQKEWKWGTSICGLTLFEFDGLLTRIISVLLVSKNIHSADGT